MNAPKKTLPLAPDLALPLSAITDKIAFVGRTGGGKTYAAMKFAELLLEVGAQAVILDPVGKWYGLRLAGDGPGFHIPVFGGQHADYPLDPSAGRFVGQLVAQHKLSVVLDVSMFLLEDQIRFATDFANSFFQAKKSAPSAVHVFLEECQEFVPQNLNDKGASEMVQAWQRIWKIGRNFGVGGSLISQRPQEINKRVLNQSGALFVFGMTGPHDRAVIEKWVADQDGINDDIGDVLPKLKNGTPHVWIPELKISRTIRIAKKRTADVTSTPKFGEDDYTNTPMAAVDLANIAAQMAELVEVAERADPKALRRKVDTLSAENARLAALLELEKGKPAVETVREKRVEVPILTDDDVSLFRRVEERLGALTTAVGTYNLPAPTTAPQGTGTHWRVTNDHHAVDAVSLDQQKISHLEIAPGVKLDRMTTAILSALASRPDGLKAKTIGTVSGYSTSGPFMQRLRNLARAGFITDAKPRVLIRITAAGARHAPREAFVPMTLSGWIAKSNRTGRRILETLSNATDMMTPLELARVTGMTTSGPFMQKIRDLIKMGVLVGSVRNGVMISPEVRNR